MIVTSEQYRDRALVVTASLVAAVAAGTLAGAWFFELVLDIRPCPLCLEQRYAYYIAIPLALSVAIAAKSGLPRGVLVSGLVVLALAALGNVVLGGYHAGVEWKFWLGPQGCSGSVVDLGSAGSLLGRLNTVKVVRCDEVQWRFLGLSLAGYNVVISIAMSALAAWGMRGTLRHPFDQDGDRGRTCSAQSEAMAKTLLEEQEDTLTKYHSKI